MSLRDLLRGERSSATIYRPAGTSDWDMDTSLVVLVDAPSSPHYTHKLNTDDTYLVEAHLIDDIILAFDSEFGRRATDAELVRAISHYAEHDAFIQREDLVAALETR